MPQFKTSPAAAPKIMRINRFRGLNKASTAAQIDITQSPDLLNMVLDEREQLDKRTGYARIYTTSLGSDKINGMYQYRKKDGTTTFLIAWGTGLYTQTGSDQPVSIYSSLANARVRFFTFNDKCYILDDTNFLVYDGSSVDDVATDAYVPTLQISTPPAGGGTAYEDFNLLTPAFKQSFSADGSATDYQLSLTDLDATEVTATVDGADKTEDTDFTVNRTTGVVAFGSAPATGTNNVIIQAYKTVSGKADMIQKCTLFTMFGGTNDTRVFLSGNPDYPNRVWRCGVFDPTYWGENKYEDVGSDASAVMGFAKQYDYCVILKEQNPNDSTLYSMTYDVNDGINPLFPTKRVNDAIGCQASDSIQILENLPTFFSPSGVYTLTASNVRDERNVTHVSDDIDRTRDITGTVSDRALLDEDDPQDAVSIDYEKKYFLAMNGYVYVYDYRPNIKAWFIWDNVPASCFLEMGGYLYFGSNTAGLVYKFKKYNENNAYMDDGTAINGYWKSKEIAFDADEFLKMVEKVFVSLKPNSNTSADIFYITDREISELISSPRVDLFDFNNFDFTKYSFLISAFPQEEVAKIKAKKVVYFQLVLQNNKDNESMGILSVGLKYHMQREVK